MCCGAGGPRVHAAAAGGGRQAQCTGHGWVHAAPPGHHQRPRRREGAPRRGDRRVVPRVRAVPQRVRRGGAVETRAPGGRVRSGRRPFRSRRPRRRCRGDDDAVEARHDSRGALVLFVEAARGEARGRRARPERRRVETSFGFLCLVVNAAGRGDGDVGKDRQSRLPLLLSRRAEMREQQLEGAAAEGGARRGRRTRCSRSCSRFAASPKVAEVVRLPRRQRLAEPGERGRREVAVGEGDRRERRRTRRSRSGPSSTVAVAAGHPLSLPCEISLSLFSLLDTLSATARQQRLL